MVEDGDLSGNIESAATNVSQIDDLSIVIAWNGSGLTGTFSVEARNGENDSFRELDFGDTIDIDADTGDHRVVFTEVPFTEVKLKYTASAGTGTVNAYLTMKSGGA